MQLKLTQKQDLKTFTGIALTFLSLLALLSLVSCAPKVEKRVYPEPKTDFGPTQKDSGFGLDELKVDQNAVVSTDQLQWSANVDSARVFRFGETLNILGRMQRSSPLMRLSRRVGQSFYSRSGTATQNLFEDSLYISAAAGETQKDSLKTVKEADDLLAREMPRIDGILNSLAKRTEWAKPEASTHDMLAVADEFGARFLRHLKREEIDPQIRVAVEEALKKDYFPLLTKMDRDINEVLSAPRSVDVIRKLREMADKSGFKIGDETQAELAEAEAVMLHIEGIRKKHDALTVIVELWEMTDPASREETFKPVSKELYNYLDGKGRKSLACVKNPKCGRPLVWLAKKVAILPAIEKYGIEQIREDISKAAREALVERIKEEIAILVPTIPQEISVRIGAEIGGVRKILASVQKDYVGFLKKIAAEYAKNELRGKEESTPRLQGLEASRVRVSISKEGVSIRPESSSSQTTSGAEAIGAAMAYAPLSWERDAKQEPVRFQKSVLSQINKMLAVGGFKDADGKRFESLAISIDPQAKQRHFYIRDFMNSSTGYAVPDLMQVSSSMKADDGSDGLNIGIRGQGELLRGFSAMIRYFRDWEKNSFDETLGTVEIGKLIKDLPAESLHDKLFPKDMFFSIAVGNSAAILQNMTKKLSPVFLIDIKNQTSWSNDRDTESDTPATMAAVVDIRKGKRTELVKTADVARFLLAITDFLDATEGIENTKSGPLTERDSEGNTAIDQLTDAKRDLKQLIVGIGNFLSHQMAEDDGGVRASFSQTLVSVKAGEARTLNDQVLAILALERASAVLGKDVYAWSALDTFAYMNRALWNPKTGFYRAREGSDEKPSLDEMAEAILAGEKLKPRMSAKSRQQWEAISQPWLRALEQI